MTKRLIIGLGELLWDLLPDGKQLGGAPANFAAMAARLGNHAVVASRIGSDAAGAEARARLAELPLDSSHLQLDPEHATGSASVSLSGGQPGYVIHQPVAWDFLSLTPEWRTLAARADAVCFGTLAQRSETSRQTIRGFLAATFPQCVRVFDVNLRKPFFTPEVLLQSLALATILKLNDEELPQVLSHAGLGSADTPLAGAHLLLDSFPLNLICITMGGHGSLLVTRETHHRHDGVPCKVENTVGAGDAFTAALVSYYLRGASLAVLNEAGNLWGAWIASQAGAIPPLPEAVYRSITKKIQSAAK